MKTLVIGYDNVKGQGEPVILKGPNVDQGDQVKFVHDAKSTNTFPKGIRNIQFCILEERVTAIETFKPEAKPAEVKTEPTKSKK